MRTIVVVDYDPSWPEVFERLRAHIWPALSDVALTVEHVGSTSVPGLAAKPIIDMTIVVPTSADIPVTIERLATLGYVHRGNLGVEGREAFYSPDGLPAHHLYLCPRNSPGLRNHLAVRDSLRTHPDMAHEYGELKKRLAKDFPNDIESYIEGKTDLILRILRSARFPAAELDVVESANRKAPEMTAEAAVDLLRLFEAAGIEVWLDGGWAVDAALGEQTRPHKDLDIILPVSDLPRLRKVLDERGFRARVGGTEFNFVLVTDQGLEIDVHAIVVDEGGNGIYRMANGADWIFPAVGFAGRGKILGLTVRCLSPEVQVLCHAHGYVPAEKDLRDMELLAARFGVELPQHLRRQARSTDYTDYTDS